MLATRIYYWYLKNQRDWPWRKSRDPYGVWISEIMLQQTRVQVVSEKYRAFMARFPSIRELAEAPLEDVLKIWEGLGYYRRARMLHGAAQIIMADHGGDFPTGGAVTALPGIGDYTSAAIRSIAFREDIPVIDGNVVRVLSRLFMKSNPGEIKKIAISMLEEARQSVIFWDPGAYNQAIMEFGQRTCTKSAICESCVVADQCLAYQDGVVDQYPPVKKKKYNDVRAEAWIASTGNRILMDLCDGMYSLPKQNPGCIQWRHCGSFRHTIQLDRMKVDVFTGEIKIVDQGTCRAVEIDALPETPMTGWSRKALRFFC